jgi:hypothetical protein
MSNKFSKNSLQNQTFGVFSVLGQVPKVARFHVGKIPYYTHFFE